MAVGWKEYGPSPLERARLIRAGSYRINPLKGGWYSKVPVRQASVPPSSTGYLGYDMPSSYKQPIPSPYPGIAQPFAPQYLTQLGQPAQLAQPTQPTWSSEDVLTGAHQAAYNRYVQERLAKGLKPLSFDAWKGGLTEKAAPTYAAGAPPSWLNAIQAKQWASLPEGLRQSLFGKYGESWETPSDAFASTLATWSGLPSQAPAAQAPATRSRWGFDYPAQDFESMFAAPWMGTPAKTEREMARRRTMAKPYYPTAKPRATRAGVPSGYEEWRSPWGGQSYENIF